MNLHIYLFIIIIIIFDTIISTVFGINAKGQGFLYKKTPSTWVYSKQVLNKWKAT